MYARARFLTILYMFLLPFISVNKKISLNIWSFQIFLVTLQPQNGKVLYGMLPRNPPGLDRSKGTWL